MTQEQAIEKVIEMRLLAIRSYNERKWVSLSLATQFIDIDINSLMVMEVHGLIDVRMGHHNDTTFRFKAQAARLALQYK